MSWVRLATVIRKEFIELRRDRMTLRIILALPVVQLLLFGYALNTVVDHLPTAVYDQSNTASSRQLVAAFQNSGYFDIRLWAGSREEAMSAIDKGAADVAIMIPPDYGDLVLTSQTATAQLVVDGSDPNVAQTALFAGGLIGQVQSGDVVSDYLSRLGRSSAQGRCRPAAGRPLQPAHAQRDVHGAGADRGDRDGALLAVTCAEPLRAIGLLQGLAGVSEVTLYGSSLHVLGQQGIEQRLRSTLDRAGIVVESIAPITPTLEDVFISLMSGKAPAE